jgi:glycosylphosphatidylinositol transamidase (GPIT) subunit GPI8
VLPDITGASGRLIYDATVHTDLASSTYGRWRVDHGAYVTVDFISSDDDHNPRAASELAIYRTLASDAAKQDLSGGGGYDPPPRTGLWALVAATSSTWENYRHQADALAAYRLLRDRGVPDDRIVLVMADDIAQDPENQLPGQVRNEPGGPNLYVDVTVDYHPGEILAADLLDILAGRSSQRLPSVITSTETDDVYVFIVGHGGDGGVGVGYDLLTPDALRGALAGLHAQNRYRRVLVEIESCHGGVMGAALDVPGVLLISGANPFENSLGANYDPELDAWVADQFAYAFHRVAAASPAIDLSDAYEKLYAGVSGSHVSVYNYLNFGDLSEIPLAEFLQP